MIFDIVSLRALLTTATPRPWEAQRDSHAPGNQKRIAWVENEAGVVADIPNRSNAVDSCEADTRIIAAAVNVLPVLLDALQFAEARAEEAEARAEKAEEWQARNSHSASEFSAACNRADAAEFALMDLRMTMIALEASGRTPAKPG